MTNRLEAFRAVDFNWTRQLKSVWQDLPYHVPSVNDRQADDIAGYFQQTTAADHSAKPLGRVVVGVAGIGKTHLVGELRRRVWGGDGWFLLLDFIGIKDFWSSVALGFLNSLQVHKSDGRPQYRWLVQRLASYLGLPKSTEIAARKHSLSRDLVNGLIKLFTGKLAERHREELFLHQDVVKALMLLYSDDFECANVAHAWLQGVELDKNDVKPLGIKSVKQQPIEIVRGLSWLMSLTGPTLIAVDQIDAIVSESTAHPGGAVSNEALTERSIIEGLAQGLMDLHEVTRRSVTVVACLEATWQVLKTRASVPVTDRFTEPTLLTALKESSKGRELVAARLREAYSARGFQPPYETWPFPNEAFETALGFSPRQLLKACDEHRLTCVAAGVVTECKSFSQVAPPVPVAVSSRENLDQEFDAGRKAAVVGNLLDHDGEDKLRHLLHATLSCFARHLDLPDDIDVEVRTDPDQKRPSLHGRLAFTFHSEGDREQHYCLRILSHTNAIAFQSRLKAAMTASGVDRALPFRHLFILRRDDPPSGKKTAEMVEQFRTAGGRFVKLHDDDIRVFLALQQMAKRDDPRFEPWLPARRPLCDTAFFKTLELCPPPFLASKQSSSDIQIPDPPVGKPADTSTAIDTPIREGSPPSAGPRVMPPPSPRAIAIGRRFERGLEGEPAFIPADVLPRHTAVLAGSGSGKTVLIRRIVEEAALLGIPAVALDSNNDLARLGEAWPNRPPQWTDADAEKAAEYHRTVEVMIWTPGRAAGNPLSLPVLPDFSAVVDNADEREQAVDMARATLEPLVHASGKSGLVARGVLADSLRAFARQNPGGLTEFLEFLSDLPDGISQINDAPKLASKIADQLHAAIATNPLLQAHGQPVDCRMLFNAAASGRTRISVVNLSGLGSEDVRNNFVNQLNMALFSWITRNPSQTGRLYVIDEAQNFAPSQQSTACKQSTVSLVSQARKYGLGMIFATQTPKGIDNKVVSNCTTHFYGKMNSPATIAATQELLQAKGGSGGDIAKLPAGEFYFATEGLLRPVKVRTALCLSHHPKSPLTAEEVIERAQRHRSRPRTIHTGVAP